MLFRGGLSLLPLNFNRAPSPSFQYQKSIYSNNDISNVLETSNIVQKYVFPHSPVFHAIPQRGGSLLPMYSPPVSKWVMFSRRREENLADVNYLQGKNCFGWPSQKRSGH